MKLDLTKEEIDFIYDRCQRKALRLEEAQLTDADCYKLAYSVMHKINKEKKV